MPVGGDTRPTNEHVVNDKVAAADAILYANCKRRSRTWATSSEVVASPYDCHDKALLKRLSFLSRITNLRNLSHIHQNSLRDIAANPLDFAAGQAVT